MTPAAGIDHLIYASSSLERGIGEIEQLLGVRPLQGGRHPQYGTHNALLSLGAGTYLEIIARDPDLPVPERGVLIDVAPAGSSRLFTWVFRAADIEECSQALRHAGIDPGPVVAGKRQLPDGKVINWKVSDPYAMPLDGAIPFLINWGNTIHPSETAPPGGRLARLVIQHPEAERVRTVLAALGARIEVTAGERFIISATIKTENGLIMIE